MKIKRTVMVDTELWNAALATSRRWLEETGEQLSVSDLLRAGLLREISRRRKILDDGPHGHPETPSSRPSILEQLTGKEA